MDISHDTANRTKMQWILTFVWKYSRRCGILSFIVTIYEEFVNRFGQKKRENVTAVFEKFIEKICKKDLTKENNYDIISMLSRDRHEGATMAW